MNKNKKVVEFPIKVEKSDYEKKIDYRELYFKLYADVTTAIEQLQQVQIDAEERYLAMGDE
ncbi:MAG: hypothetical protein ACI4PV_03305 [Butyricicoccus sp.]